MSCRLFIDEVGNADLRGSATEDNVRYLSLTGIITKQAVHDRYFQPHLDALKAAHFGHSEATPLILHRREIMRAEGPFAVLRDAGKRTAFDADLLCLLKTLPYIAITVTIDKREHLNRYAVWHFDPYHYCMRCMIERYVLWLNRHKLTGDVAAEPRFKKGDKRVKASFQKIYSEGTEHVPETIIQRRLTSHEIKFFPKMQNVAGMQVCDLLAHPSFRSMKHERDGVPSPDDFGTKIVDVLLRSRYSRDPRNKIIDGWGRKWLP